MLEKFKAAAARAWGYVRAICGNSKTIAVAYALEVLAYADEIKAFDWSALFGVERGGRIAAIVGVIMFALRLITSKPATFSSGA